MYIFNCSNYMISIDWLQAYCHGNLLAEGDYSSAFGGVSVKLLDGGTANFAKRYSVTAKGLEIATVLQSPKYSVFDAKMTEVKLHNRVLYTCRPAWFMVQLCKALALEYRGISRIDLALDCNCLAGGRSVEDLISSFVHLRVGEVGHVVRKGSARYNLHGNNHRRAAIRHESIKFGSPTSAVVPYIYNKSLELITVKDKPWIREAWREAGLVHIVDEEGLQRLSAKELAHKIDDEGVSEFIRSGVWRFEISIKGRGKDLLNLRDGDLFRLGLDSISTAAKIEELFKMYAEKYFSFRECDHGETRIRDYRKIVLWELSGKCDYRPISIPSTGSTGKFDRSVVNYIDKAMRTYSDLASPVLTGLQDVKEFIQTIAGAKAYKLRKKRYEDYLSELECVQFFDSLLDEVAAIPEEVAALRDSYREWLACHSEHCNMK